MHLVAWRRQEDRASGPYLPTGPIGLTDAGLVGGVGSTFMRMRKKASGTYELAFDQDRERLIALLSVAADRPVAEAEVRPHIAAAAAHWQRGDKALANLRLVFASLPNVSDQTSACRVALAEHLLDSGWSPRGLMIELGLTSPLTEVKKYNPNHVPAGNGRRGGQFDFRYGAIVVAGEDEEKTFQERELSGETTPKEELEHGHPITPTTGVPLVGSRGGAAVEPSATIEIPVSRFGQAAQHILDAQTAGQPDVLTIARDAATANRRAATGGLPKVPDMHLDEYPMAMFREGGEGASVRAIDPSANKALGAYVSRRCLSYPNGSTIRFKVVP